MDNRIHDAFDTVQTPDRLKRATKAALRKKTFDYGRNEIRLWQYRRRTVSALVSLALVLSGAGLWFLPATSIAVDINPSIELKVNSLDRVIALEGKNSDGIALAEQINVTGMVYDDAMQRILLSKGMEPYLDQNSTITITVAGGRESHTEQMLSRVLCRAYHIAEEENILYCQVDWETVKAARSVNLCIPRYLAWQNLLQTDPTMTPEDVRELPKETIRVLAQTIIIEDPCHE